ncbi:MAG TPA: DUF2914 domain-containing protein [Candidatus Paceibacterota bacterium]|nr:DUF2914 domain-containing protein [Candidatus Paceibacterota bacterium]
MDRISKALLFYLRYRHTFSPIIFAITFIIDVATFPQVDSPRAILLASIYAGLTLFLLFVFARSAEGDMSDGKSRRWDPTVKLILDILLQFAFGAFASVLFVSYLKGSDVITSIPFLLILFVFVTGNEFASNHRSRVWVRFSATLFLCYAYLLYLVPLVRNELGFTSLSISTALTGGLAVFMLMLLGATAPRLFMKTKVVLISATIAILLGIPLLIYSGSIPPLPLMLREGTVLHDISRVNATDYLALQEPQAIYARFGLPRLLPRYHVRTGEGLTFFTAVYAPADIKTNLIHRWERFDPALGEYVQRSVIPLVISGGRQNGYRTYSTVDSIEPGTWRVVAELGAKQILGYRTFEVLVGNPSLKEVIK